MASSAIKPPNTDIAWRLEVGTTVTFLCAAIVVFLRIFVRTKYSPFGLDDAAMVFALVRILTYASHVGTVLMCCRAVDTGSTCDHFRLHHRQLWTRTTRDLHTQIPHRQCRVLRLSFTGLLH